MRGEGEGGILWRDVIVEGDAQVVIRALQGSGSRSGLTQLIVEDTLDLKSHFDSIVFRFCYRECNSVAHRLARWGITQVGEYVWYDGGPVWICHVLATHNCY